MSQQQRGSAFALARTVRHRLLALMRFHRRAAVSTVLCGSLLALVACAVCGVSLGSSASLAVMVVVGESSWMSTSPSSDTRVLIKDCGSPTHPLVTLTVMMIRYTMEVQIRLLDAELQEAVTTDVAEALIQRCVGACRGCALGELL